MIIKKLSAIGLIVFSLNSMDVNTSWSGSCEQVGLICCCGSCGTGLSILSGVESASTGECSELIVPTLFCFSIACGCTYRLPNGPDFHCCIYNRIKKVARNFFSTNDDKKY